MTAHVHITETKADHAPPPQAQQSSSKTYSDELRASMQLDQSSDDQSMDNDEGEDDDRPLDEDGVVAWLDAIHIRQNEAMYKQQLQAQRDYEILTRTLENEIARLDQEIEALRQQRDMLNHYHTKAQGHAENHRQGCERYVKYYQADQAARDDAEYCLQGVAEAMKVVESRAEE